MATKSKLNNAKSEVIEENILLENPEGLPDSTGIVLSKHIPKMKWVKFLNGRDPGIALEFHYHSKTHPLKHYTLYHGAEVELPEEIIEHLESCCESQYGYRNNSQGMPEMYYKPAKYIFQCRPVKRAA